MTQVYYPNPFHNGGDVTETEYEKFATGYIVDGIYSTSAVPPSDAPLVFADSSGRQVKFKSNAPTFVRGGIWSSDSTVTVSVAANSSGSTRIDLATLRLDRAASTDPVCAPHVITGTPGNNAPPPTQNAPGSGVWDLPMAEITVRSGVSAINASDIKPVAWYVGEPTYLCKSTTRPPHKFGRRIKEQDTGKEYVSDGSNWTAVFDDSGWVTVAVNTANGWSASGRHQVRRINGAVYLQFEANRAGGDLSPSTDSHMGTIPTGFRVTGTAVPALGHYGASSLLARCEIDSLGQITITQYAGTLKTSDDVTLQPISWPLG